LRTRIGEAGIEEILTATIDPAVRVRVIKSVESEGVIVDATVQEKALEHGYFWESRPSRVSW